MGKKKASKKASKKATGAAASKKSNLDRLVAAGLLKDDQPITAAQRKKINSLTSAEVASLVKLIKKVRVKKDGLPLFY